MTKVHVTSEAAVSSQPHVHPLFFLSSVFVQLALFSHMFLSVCLDKCHVVDRKNIDVWWEIN